jgi:hypothetical protein
LWTSRSSNTHCPAAARAERLTGIDVFAVQRAGARLPGMAKKKTVPKKSKKQKPAAKKPKAKAKVKSPAAKTKTTASLKAKIVAPAKSKAVPKAKAAARTTTVAKGRTAPRRASSDSDTDLRENQEVEIVHPKGRSRVARAGAGSGDLQGISSVEDVDSESADELLEEGQSFEAGIISGVERAGSEESEVVTHEVLEDDVPLEYDDDGQPDT